MRDTLSPPPQPVATSDLAKSEALHAMGAFYVRQGFPKQGLSLLLAASKFTAPTLELNRAIAHAYILAGVPQNALSILDALAPSLDEGPMLKASQRLRARALMALGHVDEAKAAFAASTQQSSIPVTPFRLVGQSE